MFDAQQWLFESVFQPVMLWLDMGSYVEDGYVAAAWFLWGCFSIAVIAFVFVPFQNWRPVEAMRDRATVKVDMLYTFIHRLGLFRLFMFLTIEPLLDEAFGALRSGDLTPIGLQGIGTFHLDQLWPSVTDNAITSFLIYLVALDFVGYWIHRAQHGLPAWWALHSLHHSQQQMTCWSDNRNHLLDDIVVDVLFICAAFLIGVSPSQFVLIVVLTQLSESFQHANVRLSFGRIGERLWVSPRFHRLHHSVSHGFGHNFGVLLPWWDTLFGTANFENRYDPTGVDDQPVVDYGCGFWAQQWLGLKRMMRA
jgi:sterol desaturase/sphingolipid hydroxylase (fatty acid hydroxylase superfamily)